MLVELIQEPGDIFPSKASVPPAADAVGSYHPLVAPPPYGVVVYMK